MSIQTNIRTLLSLALLCGLSSSLLAQSAPKPFRIIAIAEKGGIHKPFVDAAKVWLAEEAKRDHFTIDYIEDTTPINEEFLSHYQLFLQLNFPPYTWTPTAAAAFHTYIEEGRGGWIGFHHATLLGKFDGFEMDPWFYRFMGSIRFKSYIATFATGTVTVEDATHPATKGLTHTFPIENEEWYTYDTTPRPNVRVLATVDENTYNPGTSIKMGGDHPVIWTNELYKARNIYIFMGHHPELFGTSNFTTLVHNSILWASQK
jgi:type 1 glutamine amidotransferase